jgi:hypothetical protein
VILDDHLLRDLLADHVPPLTWSGCDASACVSDGRARDAYRVSTLGAKAVAAAERLDAPLCVWTGDDGPGFELR